jgi:VanZ family protein
LSSASPAARRHQRFRRWIRWVTTLCWAGLIFRLSTEGFGSSFTEWLANQALSLFRLHVSPGTLQLLNFLLRKLAHLTEYAIFAELLYASLVGADELEWRPRTMLWSALIAGAYSLTDEFHQSFVPNRTASLADCALDTAGALLGLLVLYLVMRRLQANKRRAAAREASIAET